MRMRTVEPTLMPSTDVRGLPSSPATMPYPLDRTFRGFSASRRAERDCTAEASDLRRSSTPDSARRWSESTLSDSPAILCSPDDGDSLASTTSNLWRMSDSLPVSALSAREERSSTDMDLRPMSDSALSGDSLASRTLNLASILPMVPDRALEARAMSASSCASISALSLRISAAAPVGVGARTSATKSAMVKSVSWPTADTTGASEAAMARATGSSLKAQRSSRDPPPLPTISTSTPARLSSLIPETMEAAAPSPWTSAGARMMSAGNLDAEVVMMSWMTAPFSDVTTPILRGYLGRGRLRVGSKRPSASSLLLRAS